MRNSAEPNPWVDFGVLKAAVSLEAVLEHYAVNRLRRRRRDQWEGCCPLHQGEREDAFHVSLSKNVFHCFACGAQGNALDLVAAMERCSIREAALKLQAWFLRPEGGTGMAARPLGRMGTARRGELVREKLGVNAPLRFVLRNVDSAHPYLEERGIQRATAADFGVGFYGGSGLMQGRIVIPIHNPRGELVAYAGRAVNGGGPRYLLPAGFRKGLEIYNLHRAATAADRDRVIVVEGYFDCLRVHQAGFRCVVGLMGCGLSNSQETLLRERFEHVLLMLDGDEAGRSASGAIAARLSRSCSVGVVCLPDGAQPDQLPPEVMRRFLENPE